MTFYFRFRNRSNCCQIPNSTSFIYSIPTHMRFNFFSRTTAALTTNHEGAPAFALTPQLALYAAVATAALSD